MDIYTQLDNIEKYIHDNYGNSYNDFDNLNRIYFLYRIYPNLFYYIL